MWRHLATRRVVLRVAVACVALGIGIAAIFGRADRPAPAGGAEGQPEPPPQQPVSADGYVGVAVCAECHAGEHASWRKTNHSRALADLDPSVEPLDGNFQHAATGRTYSISRRGGRLWHREELLDNNGQPLVVDEHPVKYLIGSGQHTRSYLVETDGFLSESPLTWYASRKAWDLSPGYDAPTHWGFERAVETTCLYCHVGRIDSPKTSYQRLTVLEQPIGCERCHGPGAKHVVERRAKPAGVGERASIVHPGRLSRERAESICAQCHLSLDGAVNVRGKSQEDYRPGDLFSDYVRHYRLGGPDDSMHVVGHVDQMHLSKCYQKSPTMTCTTCHDPHHVPETTEKRKAEYLQACANCHADKGCRLNRDERLRRNPANDCVACHMPRVGTDIPHVAFTHHRIGIHSEQPPPPRDQIAELVPFDDTSRLTEIERERNLGLAYFGLSQRQTRPEFAKVYRERAAGLLAGIRARGDRDSETSAALMRLTREQDPETALLLAHEALALGNLSPKSRVNCLFLIAEVGIPTNRLAPARDALQELLRVRQLSQDWVLWGDLQRKLGLRAESLAAYKRASAIAPFRPHIHGHLAGSYAEMRDDVSATRERLLAERLTLPLQPRSKP